MILPCDGLPVAGLYDGRLALPCSREGRRNGAFFPSVPPPYKMASDPFLLRNCSVSSPEFSSSASFLTYKCCCYPLHPSSPFCLITKSKHHPYLLSTFFTTHINTKKHTAHRTQNSPLSRFVVWICSCCLSRP